MESIMVNVDKEFYDKDNAYLVGDREYTLAEIKNIDDTVRDFLKSLAWTYGGHVVVSKYSQNGKTEFIIIFKNFCIGVDICYDCSANTTTVSTKKINVSITLDADEAKSEAIALARIEDTNELCGKFQYKINDVLYMILYSQSK